MSVDHRPPALTAATFRRCVPGPHTPEAVESSSYDTGDKMCLGYDNYSRDGSASCLHAAESERYLRSASFCIGEHERHRQYSPSERLGPNCVIPPAYMSCSDLKDDYCAMKTPSVVSDIRNSSRNIRQMNSDVELGVSSFSWADSRHCASLERSCTGREVSGGARCHNEV